MAVVLFRETLAEESEFEVCSRHFSTVRSRMDVPDLSLVIARYSCLPYYEELEQDLASRRSWLINSHKQHRFIANVLAWSGSPAEEGGLLGSLTPYTWTEWGDLPEGAYVVKGRTNSRKHQWNTRMFAPTKADIPRIAQRLWDDSLINEQGLVVRQYVPLRHLGEGINGLPITNEWRTFWLVNPEGRPVHLASGFYWASHPEALASAYLPASVLQDVAQEAAQRLVGHATFFVLDLAETATGDWIVIEVNDGQMSGPSMVDLDELYANLARNL